MTVGETLYPSNSGYYGRIVETASYDRSDQEHHGPGNYPDQSCRGFAVQCLPEDYEREQYCYQYAELVNRYDDAGWTVLKCLEEAKP